MNEHEMEIPKEKLDVYGEYNFDWKLQVVAMYEDVPEKMIFKREYR